VVRFIKKRRGTQGGRGPFFEASEDGSPIERGVLPLLTIFGGQKKFWGRGPPQILLGGENHPVGGLGAYSTMGDII